jgi:hypothetical protein
LDSLNTDKGAAAAEALLHARAVQSLETVTRVDEDSPESRKMDADAVIREL